MKNQYRIEPFKKGFRVIGPWGEHLFNDCRSLEDAQQDILRCLRDDELHESAKLLLDIALEAHMQTHGVDRETSKFWLRRAVDTLRSVD